MSLAKPALPESKSPSRRALLAGALGGLGVVAASAVGRVSPARAANGDPVILGASNSATGNTAIASPTTTFTARSDGGGWGALGQSVGGGLGVVGISGVPLDFHDKTGVLGTASPNGGTGVHGETNGHHTSTGVRGIAKPEGVAVRAETENGIAVWAQATGGYALAVEGRAVFSRSGRLTFSAGQASRTLTASLPFLATSMVLATIQGNVAGTWVRGVSVNLTENKFTIWLNKAAPRRLRVGWFIVN